MQGTDSRIYCMMGDGELNEGQVWEAAMAAGHFGCQNLVAIVDRNRLCIDGGTEEIMSVEPLTDRFASFGWDVQRIDGHDLDSVMGAFDALPTGNKGKPQVIIADTIKGRGVQMMELSLNWHVGNLVGDDYDAVVAEIERGLQPVTVTEVRP